MLKRSLLTLFLVPTLVLAIQSGGPVHGVVMSPEELATLSATDATAAPDNTGDEKSKQDGNGFLRALKAPFKALGRVFGGGGKKKEEAKKDEPKKDDKAVQIDFDNIGQRILAIPMPARRYEGLQTGKEGMIYAFENTAAPQAEARYAIHRYELSKRKADVALALIDSIIDDDNQR